MSAQVKLTKNQKLDRILDLLARLNTRVDMLESLLFDEKEWVSPEKAAEILGISIRFLNNNRDKWGLVYSQRKPYASILYKHKSLLDFMQRKSNVEFLPPRLRKAM